MAIIYVRSTNGVSGDGLSWATAKITIAEAATQAVAGDFIYLSHLHDETRTVGTAFSWVFAGTLEAPVKMLCVNDSSGVLATTASFTNTGSSALTVSGSLICYGLNIFNGSGAVNANIVLGSGTELPQYYEECRFTINATNTGSRLFVGISGNNNNSLHKWKNCHVRFTGSAHSIAVQGQRFTWSGGSIETTSLVPTGIFSKSTTSVGRASNVIVEGVNFSAMPSTVAICTNVDGASRFIIRNCRAPTDWTGGLLNVSSLGARIEFHNLDNSDNNHTLAIYDNAGTIRTETTNIKTGGASDSIRGFSWRLSALDTVTPYTSQLDSPEISMWNTVVDAPITITVDILHSGVTKLTDADVWLEVSYFGTSGLPISSTASDIRLGILTTPVDQEVSTATWNTTGITDPNKQKLSVTLTPREIGYIQAKVVLAKPTKVIYVDPKLQVT